MVCLKCSDSGRHRVDMQQMILVINNKIYKIKKLDNFQEKVLSKIA